MSLDLLTLYELSLMRLGHSVVVAATLKSAFQILSKRRFDMVLTDMRLPDGCGLEIIQKLKSMNRSERCVMITAHGSMENAIDCLKSGAFDYINKPVDLNQLRNIVYSVMQPAITLLITSVEEEKSTPKTDATSKNPIASQTAACSLKNLVGTMPVMHRLRERIQKVAPSMAPVLILGESGTGKELVAKALHANSHRNSGPWVAVNCSAIPENLFEAEFFGAKKGSYTGSTQDREGFFQAANGGTLFLDEIGDTPLTMQSKLLRAIQERTVRPPGSNEEILVDVRIVSATHRNLAQDTHTGRFRQDLYFRLNVIDITTSPLRERRDDLPLICAHLMHRISDQNHQETRPLSSLGMRRLRLHPLMGNVRELENILYRAMTLQDLDLQELSHLDEQLPRKIAKSNLLAEDIKSSATELALPTTTSPLLSRDENEREILMYTLKESGFNRTLAAKKLGLTLRQIRYRIMRLNITIGYKP